MTQKNERLTDLIKKAGGVTNDAYTRGARLMRHMNEEERARRGDALHLTRESLGKDSISTEQLDLSEYYSVGIDLKKALEKPGSDYDLVLREGDMLYVPELDNTVKIHGDVLYPNTVLYEKGMPKSYYINQAGGYGVHAKKNRAYVVYMNGTVSRLKGRSASKFEPGCEIIVPVKSEKKITRQEIQGLSTASASLASVLASMVNLFD